MVKACDLLIRQQLALWLARRVCQSGVKKHSSLSRKTVKHCRRPFLSFWVTSSLFACLSILLCLWVDAVCCRHHQTFGAAACMMYCVQEVTACPACHHGVMFVPVPSLSFISLSYCTVSLPTADSSKGQRREALGFNTLALVNDWRTS